MVESLPAHDYEVGLLAPNLSPNHAGIEVLVVDRRPISRYMIALCNCMELLWEKEDYEKGDKYARLMASGEVFPPLLVHGGIIKDGHHRLYGAYKAGQRFIDVIDLKQQPDPYDDRDEISES